MNVNELSSIAQLHGIESQDLSQIELIRNIQSSEGNFNCFATAYEGECDQQNCSWREDCFDSAKTAKELL